MISDEDAMWARMRREVAGVSDERARELVAEWRERAVAAENAANAFDTERLPRAASIARGKAADYRRDAADLARQLD